MTTVADFTRWAAANIELELRNAAWQRWQSAAYDCRMHRRSFYMHPELKTAETVAAYRAAKVVETAAYRAYAEIERRRI